MNTDKTEIVYNTREYKYTKDSYLKVRQDIKDLSQEQRVLKPQRKADHNLTVERKVSQYHAVDKLYKNRYKLRLLFILYDEVRGKEERVKLEESKLNVYKLKDLKKLREEYLKETKTLS